MNYDLIIRNGEIVTPQRIYKADIGVKEGKITTIGEIEFASAREEYDAAGKYIFAGFIDEHVHSRDPGLTHKEDFASLTKSALAGGITTVIEMPNSVPPVSDANSFYSKAENLSEKSYTDFALLGMVLGNFNKSELRNMAEAGVVGYKLFWGYALNPDTLELVYNFTKDDPVVMPPDNGQIFEAFCEIGKTGRAVCIHAEDSEVISKIIAMRNLKEKDDYKAFLESRPPYTEELIIQTGITLANAADVHLHILHVAAGEGVDLISSARDKGMKITGETCPHYLVLTDEDYSRVGVDMKIYPPIREKGHQDKLWEGINHRKIQAVGSDHAPHMDEEKQGDLWTVPAGATGVQTLVPVMLDAVNKGKLSLNKLAEVLSENPARIWGLYGKKGIISPGADADLTVVDMNASTTIDKGKLLSKSSITPYDGVELKGAPVACFLRGVQVMENGSPLGERKGELVKPISDSQYSW